MKKCKIIIVIPCWGRVSVVNIMAQQLDEFFEYNKDLVELSVIYVLSEEDPHIIALLDVLKRSKHLKDIIYASNNKLGKKLNKGIERANELGYDYIMNMGSDDLLNNKLINLYVKYINDNEKIFGLSNLYVYNENGEVLFFNKYNSPHVVGAGRMIHKSVIDDVINKFGLVYDEAINRGMDTNSAEKINKCGYKEVAIDTGEEPYVVDIKSSKNINNFYSIARVGYIKKAIKQVNKKIIEDIFPILKK